MWGEGASCCVCPMHFGCAFLQHASDLYTACAPLRTCVATCGCVAADEDEPAPTGEACELYGKFWEQYGRAMKLGIVEDSTNRNRMAKLLRFYTSK